MRITLICLVLILANVATYALSLRNGFVDFDDRQYLTQNPVVQRGLTADGVSWAFTTRQGGHWHPLTWLSIMADCSLLGADNAAGHHASAIVHHIINTLLLFGLLRAMTGATWRSAAVALLFSVHPLRVESVAWVVQRKDLLCAMFWFAATWAYVRYARKPSWARYLVVMLLFALGLLAKPMIVTLPFALLLLDYWPLERWGNRAAGRRLVIEKLPLLAMSLVFCFVTYAAQQSGQALASAGEVPIASRLSNAVVAYGQYLFKTIWPVDLALIYPHPTLIEGAAPLQTWQIVGAAVLLVAITVYVVRVAHRRYLTVGWFWFVGTLIPVIGLVQQGAQAYADRFTYIPQIGLLIMAVWWLGDWASKDVIRKRVACVLVFVSAAALMCRAADQVTVWRDGVTLFEHNLQVTGDNYIVHAHLGDVLFFRGDYDRAVEHYRQAVTYRPQDAQTTCLLARAHRQAGEFQQALEQYRLALQLVPNWPVALNGIGVTFMMQGRYEQAIAVFDEVLRIDPASLPGKLNRERAVTELAGRSGRSVQPVQ